MMAGLMVVWWQTSSLGQHGRMKDRWNDPRQGIYFMYLYVLLCCVKCAAVGQFRVGLRTFTPRCQADQRKGPPQTAAIFQHAI
ncbi:MAG: hypothetical protein ABIQ90_15400 [Polaromonas sp.]